ncbi:MAG: S41 family peptidase [Kangiellaceae bacterium]|nr:S41 family peptidase [Kangiellaceae bacterium]
MTSSTPKTIICSLFIMITASLPASDLVVAAPSKTTPTVRDTLPLEELRTFSEVFYHVKSSYVEDVDDKVLINAAIEGMVSSLDPHSRYLDPTEFASFTADNDGEYEGLGLSFDDHPLGIKIRSVVNNSPADRKKLIRGMLVTKINNINIKDISSEDAYKLLKGKVGSQVKLTVLSPSYKSANESSKKASKNYVLTREIIIMPSVVNAILPNRVGYLAIDEFTRKTSVEFIQAMDSMTILHPLNSLIIDLRNNLGGALETSIEISDLFIDSGILLTSTGRASGSNEIYRATPFAPYSSLNVTILINAYTASSSEILAAALQDHKKATLLGDVSYGKGSIQTVYLLRQASGLKLTTAKYFSPNGNEIQGFGIKPDVRFQTAGLVNNREEPLLDDLELLQAFNLVQAKEK